MDELGQASSPPQGNWFGAFVFVGVAIAIAVGFGLRWLHRRRRPPSR